VNRLSITYRHFSFKLNASILGCLVLFLFSNCSDTPSDLSTYGKWFNQEHGYINEKFINKLSFRVQYKPIELMMLRELEANTAYSKEEIENLRESFGSSLYFLLEIAFDERAETINEDLLRITAKDYNAFAENVKHFAFNMESAVELSINGATIVPVIYHYERGFELGKKQRFLFAFQPPESINKEEVTFVFYDDIFKTGKNNFKFKVINEEVPPLPIDYKNESV